MSKILYMSFDVTLGHEGESMTSCGEITTPQLVAREALGIDREHGTPIHAAQHQWADFSIVARRDLSQAMFDRLLRRAWGEVGLAMPLLGLPEQGGDVERRLKLAADIAAARGRRWWM